MKKHSENALKIANWLFTRGSFPDQSSKFNSLAKKYLPNGQSGLVTFGVKGGYDHAKRYPTILKYFLC